MARLRTRLLNPDVLSDGRYQDMSIAAQHLWDFLPCIADKEGRLVNDPRTIRWQVFPAHDVDVPALIKEIECAGFIVVYEVGGQRLIEVQNFAEYRKAHPRESKSVLPGPSKASLDGAKAAPRSAQGEPGPAKAAGSGSGSGSGMGVRWDQGGGGVRGGGSADVDPSRRRFGFKRALPSPPPPSFDAPNPADLERIASSESESESESEHLSEPALKTLSRTELLALARRLGVDDSRLLGRKSEDMRALISSEFNAAN